MRRKFFIPWSKVLTASVVLLAYGFVIWACFEMHRLDDLSPIAYIGASIIGLVATVITAYMWRAKHKGLVEGDKEFTEFMAELEKKYGPGVKAYRTQQPGDGGSFYSSGWGGGSTWGGGSNNDDGMVG